MCVLVSSLGMCDRPHSHAHAQRAMVTLLATALVLGAAPPKPPCGAGMVHVTGYGCLHTVAEEEVAPTPSPSQAAAEVRAAETKARARLVAAADNLAAPPEPVLTVSLGSATVLNAQLTLVLLTRWGAVAGGGFLAGESSVQAAARSLRVDLFSVP